MSDIITELIEEITPLNNEYRIGIKANLPGNEILKIMWDAGEILVSKGIKNIHPIAWKIYGKEKGLRRSYITRDFLSYCFRIRKYFKNKSEIDKKFPNLQRYTLFREALPLLDNPKYSLSSEEKRKLLDLLNSNKSYQVIKNEIIKTKRKKHRIYNDRRQKLGEVIPIKDNFIKIYEEIFKIVENNEYQEIEKLKADVGAGNLLKFSQFCLSLTQEGLSFPELKKEKIKKLDDHWEIFGENLIELSNADEEKRNRFRRVIPISKIMGLAEMLKGITTNEGFSRLVKKWEAGNLVSE
ncbi:MAG: hypothetical protein R6V27_09550 [Balneolaceae bacterium]